MVVASSRLENRQDVERVRTRESDFFIDNLLVQTHLIILMIRWTGLALWEFRFPFPGCLTYTFVGCARLLPLSPSICIPRARALFLFKDNGFSP